MSQKPDAEVPERSIFGSEYRIVSLGILILMTIIAFEALAVATALPTAARSLHGLASYGWAFTGFLVASIVGMVVSGMRSDARGPRLPLLAGLALFIAGLLVASAAEQMWMLIAARVVQGFAVGLAITAMYVMLGEAYPDDLRPKMFAGIATAWVVPGLVGPIAAGWITEQFSWRWVFGGLAPFAALGGAMLLPSLRQLRTTSVGQKPANNSRIWYSLLAAFGIAGVAGVGEHQNLLSITLAVLGLAAMVLGLLRLLPRGTARFAPGVPAAIAFRGVLSAVFVGMEVLIPLTLSVQRHYSPTMAGLPLMLTALTWALASQLQSRVHNPDRARFLRLGLSCIAVAGVGMALVAGKWVPGWGAFVAWPLGGFGAGFALTGVSVALLEYTNDADRGSDSSSLQLADSALAAVSAAFSGALVALAANGRIGYGTGLPIAYLTLAVVAVLATGRSARLRPVSGVVVPEASAVPSGTPGAVSS